MLKIKKLNVVIVGVLLASIMTGCSGKNKEKPEVTNNLNKGVQEEVAKTNNKGRCPEINKVTPMNKVDCLSSDIIERQIQYRVDAKIAKAYGIEYDINDVMNYYTEQINKTENSLHYKSEVADKLEADILMVGLENYSRDHVMQYLTQKIEDKEKDRILNQL